MKVDYLFNIYRDLWILNIEQCLLFQYGLVFLFSKFFSLSAEWEYKSVAPFADKVVIDR